MRARISGDVPPEDAKRILGESMESGGLQTASVFPVEKKIADPQPLTEESIHAIHLQFKHGYGHKPEERRTIAVKARTPDGAQVFPYTIHALYDQWVASHSTIEIAAEGNPEGVPLQVETTLTPEPKALEPDPATPPPAHPAPLEAVPEEVPPMQELTKAPQMEVTITLPPLLTNEEMGKAIQAADALFTGKYVFQSTEAGLVLKAVG
jgi:hypothetical protein